MALETSLAHAWMALVDATARMISMSVPQIHAKIEPLVEIMSTLIPVSVGWDSQESTVKSMMMIAPPGRLQDRAFVLFVSLGPCHDLCILSSSCLNNGRCIDGVNGYTCQCPSDYTGSNCQYHINPCDHASCLNEATCIEQGASYRCHCPFGFTGPRCEVSFCL